MNFRQSASRGKLTAQQVAEAVKMLGFENEEQYRKHLASKAPELRRNATIKDLEASLWQRQVAIDDFILGDYNTDKAVSEIHGKVYGQERIRLPQARIELVMDLADYFFPPPINPEQN